jgi:replicative DNA helicase
MVANEKMLKAPKSAIDIAADDLCAVIAMNDAEYSKIRFEYGIVPKLMPSQWHTEFCQAVYNLRENGHPVHDALVQERCQTAPLSWILQIMTLYDDTRIGIVAKENARIVREDGLKRGTLRLLEIAQQQITEGKDRETVAQRLSDLLASIGNVGDMRNVRASDHADMNRAKRETPRENGAMPTGLGWWDESSIQYEHGQIWWIAGAYKSRKTSLALNLALSAAMRGSVGILSKEMPQDRIQSIMEAMLAVSYLKRMDLVGKSYASKNGTYMQYDWISGKSIRQSGATWRGFNSERANALEYAFETYKSLNLRVYDASSEHGGLDDFASLQRVISRDCQHDKGKLFFVDYFQLFAGASYEEIANLAKQLQTFARKMNITLVMLAQRNEDSIKGGGNSYSAGIKGGGDASATADYLFITRYKEAETDTEHELDLQIKHAREDASGGALRRNMPIHPQSGLIFDMDFVKG